MTKLIDHRDIDKWMRKYCEDVIKNAPKPVEKPGPGLWDKLNEAGVVIGAVLFFLFILWGLNSGEISTSNDDADVRGSHSREYDDYDRGP